jgi:outer membrane lipoprotein-sorting protein
VTTALAVVALAGQISAAAVVARVKENDVKIRDLKATAALQIVSSGETRTRSFELWLRREGVAYRARIRLLEPPSMRGTEFLVFAERGKRNEEWAYFPDLDLVREIPGKQQDDPFLGSDVTYADLAGGAHLDDLEHRLLGEDRVGSHPCYVMEGVPRHRIAYGKLRGYVRKSDFMTVAAEFFDHDGRMVKEARLSDIRDLGGGTLFAHHIELESATVDRKTVLTFRDVAVNEGIPAEWFRESGLGK